MFKRKKIEIILLSILLLCSITGCAGKKNVFNPLPISVDGTELLLGQSTLQTFIDAGYKVTLDKKLEQDIKGEEMPSMTYDFAAYVSKNGIIVGEVDFLNNTSSTIPFADCIVNEYEITYMDPYGAQNYDAENILVDDINLNGMKLEDVKKAFEDKTESFSDIENPDGSIAIVSFYINKVRISVHFDYTNKEVTTVETEVFLQYFE